MYAGLDAVPQGTLVREAGVADRIAHSSEGDASPVSTSGLVVKTITIEKSPGPDAIVGKLSRRVAHPPGA